MQSNLAGKFQEAANSYGKRVAALRNSGTSHQRVTPRRQRIVEQQLRDANRLEEVQRPLAALAAAWSAGVIPGSLLKITDALQVETLVRYETMPSPVGYSERAAKALMRAGIHSDETFFRARAELLALVPPADDSTERLARIRQMEREMVMRNIPDFFPTPPAIIEKMLMRAAIETHHRVLEPHVGSARIADAIQKHYPSVQLDCLEYNTSLAELARLKGYDVELVDFLDYTGGPYDRIIQNPPFSGMAEIAHIKHAYGLLRPGGRLVSLASMSPFHQSVRRAQEFRHWVEGKGAIIEDLPPDAFRSAERPTGVSTCIITMSRWED